MGALNNDTTRSQNKALLNYLKAHKKGVSATEAWNALGIERVSARIWDLRHKYGHSIDKVWYQYENDYGHTVRFCRYVLVKEAA